MHVKWQMHWKWKNSPTSTILPLSITTILSAACMVESLQKRHKLQMQNQDRIWRINSTKVDSPVCNNNNTSHAQGVIFNSAKNTLHIKETQSSTSVSLCKVYCAYSLWCQVTLSKLLEADLDIMFTLSIQCTSGFIKDQYFWIPQDSSSNSNSLLLSPT